MLIMSIKSWIILYGVMGLACMFGAYCFGARQMAMGIFVGTLAGIVLAIVPLWALMKISSAVTGNDAGNAGVFFVCTVPTLPLLGLLIGIIVGYQKETR